MILEGVVIAPRWSATSSSIVGVVIQLLVLELLSQTEAVLHLMFGVLVKRAHAIEDLLVLFVVVALGMRLTDSGDDVVWLAVASSIVTESTRRAMSFRSLLLSVETRPPKMVVTTLSWSWKALLLPLGGRRPLAPSLASSSSFLS